MAVGGKITAVSISTRVACIIIKLEERQNAYEPNI